MDRNHVKYQPTNCEQPFGDVEVQASSKKIFRVVSRYWRQIIFLLAPIALSPIIVIYESAEYRAAYVVSLMALYWLTEAIPLAVTALIPVFLYPVLGIASSLELCPTYMKEVMMLTVASLMLGVAMESHNVHRRIALRILLVIGTGPNRLLLGFLSAGSLLSMVTTNCATATMMVPVAKAVLNELEFSREDQKIVDINASVACNKSQKTVNSCKEQVSNTSSPENVGVENTRPLYLGCLLAVAYGTSIGGTGTLTGGAPNLILKSYMDDKYTDYKLLTFGSWTLYNLPGMILAVLAAWVVLFCVYVRKSKSCGEVDTKVREFLKKKYVELGPVKAVEKNLFGLFLLLMLLWFFRSPGFMTGWADMFSWGDMIGNATPAVFVALLLFVIPCSTKEGSPTILDWQTAQERTPWGVLLLLGGGLALAHGAKKSGLMDLVADRLLGLSSLSCLLVLICLCLLTLVTTEFLSNTSTASLFVPVIDQLAHSLELHPLFLLLPVTICCSYAFMLPMATSPNAIVFQNSTMRTSEMVLPGIFLNILCCSIQIGAIYLLGNILFLVNEPITNFNLTNNASAIINSTVF